MPKKESSTELSTLASKVLRRKVINKPYVSSTDYNNLLEDAKSLAASVLSQDEHHG